MNKDYVTHTHEALTL